MSVKLVNFQQQLAEIDWVVENIQKQIKSGVKASEIAIIAPKHKYLEAITKFLLKKNIPVSYIRENSVLEEPTILALLNMAKLTHSILVNQEKTEMYWLEVLANPCWEISAEVIWKLSLLSYHGRISWMETLQQIAQIVEQNTENNFSKLELEKLHLNLNLDEKIKLTGIFNFFLKLAKESETESAEQILNKLLGVESNNLGAEDETESDGELNLENIDYAQKNLKNIIISPFKKYYFDEARLDSNLESKSDYLGFLASLRVLVDQLRKMSTSQVLLVDWLNSFEILNRSGKPLVSKLNVGDSSNAVNLITAHSAKGLEFESVYLLHCNQQIWAGKGKNSLVKLPLNLSLQPEADNRDDKIRMFFVSVTRAKKELFLTYSEANMEAEPLDKLSFLEELKLEEVEVEKDILELNMNWFTLEAEKDNLLTVSEDNFLAPELQNYQLSVTHLNNFLNVENGGPSYFLSTNLLRFPQAKSSSTTFGTLMHESIANFYKEFSTTKILPEFEIMASSMLTLLSRQRLTLNERKNMEEKALSNLKNYYEQRKTEFNFNDKIEFSFKDQGVVIGEARLSGKIDKMILDIGEGFNSDKKIIVVDLKTGKPLLKWAESGEYAKKSMDYKRQLVFYKILVENSREFKNRFKVETGQLDFIQPQKDGDKLHLLETFISDVEAEELKLLIQKVWVRIMNRNFNLPSTKYDKGILGTKQFIQELLAE